MNSFFNRCCCCCSEIWQEEESLEPLLKKELLEGESVENDVVFLSFRKKLLKNIDDVDFNSEEVRLNMDVVGIEQLDNILEKCSNDYNEHLENWDEIVSHTINFKNKFHTATFKKAVEQLKKKCEALKSTKWRPLVLSEFFIQIALSSEEKTSSFSKTNIETNNNENAEKVKKTAEDAKTLVIVSDLNQLAVQLRDFIIRHSSLCTELRTLTKPSSLIFPLENNDSALTLPQDNYSEMDNNQVITKPPGSQTTSVNQLSLQQEIQNLSKSFEKNFEKNNHLNPDLQEVINSCEDDDIGEPDVPTLQSSDDKTVRASQSNRLSAIYPDSEDYNEPHFGSSFSLSDEEFENNKLEKKKLYKKASLYDKSRDITDISEQEAPTFNNLPAKLQPDNLSLSSKSEVLSDQLDVRMLGYRNALSLLVVETAIDKNHQIEKLAILKKNLDRISRGLPALETLDLAARQLAHHIYDAVGASAQGGFY